MNINTRGIRVTNSAKFPIRFDKVHPGSTFKIVSEKSRGINYSNDNRVYRKARDHEGFYAVVENNPEVAAVIYPGDMCQPVKLEKV